MTTPEIHRRHVLYGISAAAMISASCQHVAASEAEPTLRTITVNGINMRVAEMGDGPLVILAHGWPESWYSWRHQIKALAEAGYHVVAPDMRGYGGTDAPEAIADYDIHHLAGDIVGIIDAMGEEKAHLVGHDWGAVVSWNAVHMHSDRFKSLTALSVPYGGRGAAAPTTILNKVYGDNFYYMLYFQEPGVAEAEFDADPRAILSRLYRSPDSPRFPPKVTDPKMSAGGWIPRLGELKERPEWLTAADLDYYVQQFEKAGFRGGINYYRNLDRNWKTTADLEGVTIDIPVKFIAGAQDVVLGGRNAEQLDEMMRKVCTDFRGVTLLPETGHWVQQEEADAVNTALVSFINSI